MPVRRSPSTRTFASESSALELHPYLRHGHERDACGVGFVATRGGEGNHDVLVHGLHALTCVEHRGGVLADGITGDGSGIMTDIPWQLLEANPEDNAVATLFILCEPDRRQQALAVFEQTFAFFGIKVSRYRRVPTNVEVLGDLARATLPEILQAIIVRPEFCRTSFSFEKLLHLAKQRTRTALQQHGFYQSLYFTSLSTTTTIYKAMCQSRTLRRFYPDLSDTRFVTRFALFHRRFSTNTVTSWDKAQPFRMIAHNGEINTITGNRSWSLSREREMGLARDELLTHESISDSGSLNEMVEALRYRSSIPATEDILAIMVPPAHTENAYYRFWQRAVEPWDGPAFLAFCDGKHVGARLDRNGFRPGRWAMTDEHFFLASEAGIFSVPPGSIRAKGALRAGTGLHVDLVNGEVNFRDPSDSAINRAARFEARLRPLILATDRCDDKPTSLDRLSLFGVTSEEVDRMLAPMMAAGIEPIGSMGDTAALAILSSQRRSFFDFFYQVFAQVTNPPLDYLREKSVTDLRTSLGVRPNVFAPAQLIPPVPAIALPTPVLDLDQLEAIRDLNTGEDIAYLHSQTFDCSYERAGGGVALRATLERLATEAVRAVENGISIVILSDRAATFERLPVPSLLALRATVVALNDRGLRLKCSVVIDAADVRNTHHLAALIGYGATAVCPRVAFELARFAPPRSVQKIAPEERERNIRSSFEAGLLKIMSKMGISVSQSYQSAKLFSVVGLGKEITETYFAPAVSPLGGYDFDDLATFFEEHCPASEPAKLCNTYQLREQPAGKVGEHHSFTAAQAKQLHKFVQSDFRNEEALRAWAKFGALRHNAQPVSIADLLDLTYTPTALPIEDVEPANAILARFASGAMSFGAVSGETQRDLFVAMKRLGGRSNSGEGGENPFYFSDGISASTKQVASGRFGVTAEYLVTAEEFEIKIAQGAKPGEGGQVMGVKVTPEIGRARYATPGVTLISPAPLHDIYSIEDLRELIYQLRQLQPKARVCVKLVSGHNIGTIAAGVVKAGADVIQISGGNGGTGAASISSMKHCGLPWEIGLTEVHQILVAQGLRDRVVLRVDGGLSVAKEIVVATLLGAEGFGFGKLLLGALGCIMARVCEKNTCPRGIATHDPKFKAKYQGRPEHVEAYLREVAQDVRVLLSKMGVSSLSEIVGQSQRLTGNSEHQSLLRKRKIDLSFFTAQTGYFSARKLGSKKRQHIADEVSDFNQRVVDEVARAGGDGTGRECNDAISCDFAVTTTDRAGLARLAGVRATRVAEARRAGRNARLPELHLTIRGSAGQGFATFLTAGCNVRLVGEANDGVCKSMSGGSVTVVPSDDVSYLPAEHAIIGNCALYGATGGRLLVYGTAGDRFAVRNSGAHSVVESVGFHACEYMTGGLVVILRNAGHNIGAGMTGGRLFVPAVMSHHVNNIYLTRVAFDIESEQQLLKLLQAYHAETGSDSVAELVNSPEQLVSYFHCYDPAALIELRARERASA